MDTDKDLQKSIDDLSEKINEIKEIIFLGKDSVVTKVAVLENAVETNTTRLAAVEKRDAHIQAEETKARWHLFTVLVISIVGWLITISTKVVDLETLKKFIESII